MFRGLGVPAPKTDEGATQSLPRCSVIRTTPGTLWRTLEAADVVHREVGSPLVVRAVYSGLRRMLDLVTLHPNLMIRLCIVAPDARRRRVASCAERGPPGSAAREVRDVGRSCALRVLRFPSRLRPCRVLALASRRFRSTLGAILPAVQIPLNRRGFLLPPTRLVLDGVRAARSRLQRG